MSPQTRYKQEQRFWDDVAVTDYASLSAYDQERILRCINWLGDGKVLDIGGGSGMVSRLLDREPGTESVCLDISHKMLKHSPVSAVQADALRLPFRDNSFDLVVSAAFFHHLPGYTHQLLAECHRVLAPMGRLVGYDPNAHCIQNKIFMTGGPFRLKLFSPDERPIIPEVLSQEALSVSFGKFDYFYFSFRNNRFTPFELIQRFLLSPFAVGPLAQRLERWFYWCARKE